MGDHELTESEKEDFAELREKLDGVEPAEETPRDRSVEFGPIDPMLAESFDGALGDVDSSSWIAEQKYDGTRIILEKLKGEIGAFTRRGVERSAEMPDIVQDATATLPEGVILDAEFTLLTPAGGSYFVPIHGGEEKIKEENLTPNLFIFDVLVSDSTWVTQKPLLDRKEILREIVTETDHISIVSYVESDFYDFYQKLVEKGEEGIILKRSNSHYYTGVRSSHWRKVKDFSERDVIVVGYTPGEGARRDTFGALVMTDGVDYIGRVGSGFSDDELVALSESFSEREEKPVSEADVGMPYTPIEPFVISVKYQEITDNKELRSPIFLNRRPEKPPSDVKAISDSEQG